jgi:hypothetical protein
MFIDYLIIYSVQSLLVMKSILSNLLIAKEDIFENLIKNVI